MHMIKAMVFDLHSCLAAADEVGEQLFEPAFQAIREANRGTMPGSTLAAAFADCWRFPFDFIAEKYGFSPEMWTAGFTVLSKTEVRQPMHGYGDLDALKELQVKLFLVTSGFRRLQESKVKALGIGQLFAGVYIDAIDEPGPKGKLQLFEEILKAHRLKAEEVVVVGDNPDSEIAAGNQLGMMTVQILRPGVPATEKAKRRIGSLRELVDIGC